MEFEVGIHEEKTHVFFKLHYFIVFIQWFSEGGTRNPRGTLRYCNGYVRETDI